MTTTWKTVRVFISSTFRDMQCERDWLVRFVFPKLRQELLQRRIHLVDVDLRWGVTSEQDALSVCREVVDECRPRFLCVLGGRYGWVPPNKTRSITADEVHYGVLDRDLTSRGFAYFYFREPSTTAAMVEAAPGEFREPAGSQGADALAELKAAIIGAGLQPFIYRAQWDDQSRRLIGLKEFGDRVYADLQQSIDQEFGPTTGEKPDEFTEENAAMEAFIEERVQRFVLGSRQPVWNELRHHAESTGGNGYLCLTGAADSGKSALLGKFCQDYRAAHPQDLVVPHFVGASPGSTDVWRTLRRLCHELVTGAGLTAEIPEDPEKLRVAFAEILQQASAQKRVVILLDAINQFDSTTQLAGWSWLPEELPSTARIILSTLTGPALDSLRQRRQPPRSVELQPLDAKDPEAIIREFLHRYRKSMTDDQRAALLAKADAGTPLYLMVALEQLRTLGSHEEITDCIAQLPSDTRALFVWILKRLEDDDGFRDGSGLKIGRELVSRFVSLLGASRHGLSQQELTELIAPGDPQGNVATLVRLLHPYLMWRGDRLDFYHRKFSEAVEGSYLATETQRRAANEQLANYFRSKGDSEYIGDRLSNLKGNEILARAIHDDYLRQQSAAGVQLEQNTSMVPWDALPEHLKESIRQQADDIGAKLQAVHCSMAPLRGRDEPLFEFTPDEIEQLARMEHERWMKTKLQDGWRYGAKRDKEAKIHPCLIPFEQLSPGEQDKDRHAMRQISAILAKAGFRIYRLRLRVDVDQLLITVIDTMAELLRVNAASLFLVNQDSGFLEMRGAYGYHKALLENKVTYHEGEGMTGWIAKQGECVMVNSVDELHAHPGWKGKFNQLQARATSIIRAGDIINLPLLAAKLKEPTDPVSTYLQAQFSNATRKILARYHASDSDLKPLQTALVEDINRVVCAQSIYDLQRFAGIVLRKETERALAQNPQGDSLLSLNRLLIEDAYPLELSRSHNQEPNAFLGIPLKAVDPTGRTGVIGVLKFEDRRTGLEITPTFTAEDQELGQRVASILATVLACSQFEQRQAMGLGSQLGSPTNVVPENRWQQTVMNDIVETITQVLKVDAASIYLADENRERLVIQAADGYQKALIDAAPKPSYVWGEGVTGRIAETNKEFCAMSLEELRMLGGANRGKFDAIQMNMQPCAFYGLPLNVSGEAKPIGVLKVECLQSRQFTRKDVLFMRMMGNIISATVWDQL